MTEDQARDVYLNPEKYILETPSSKTKLFAPLDPQYIREFIKDERYYETLDAIVSDPQIMSSLFSLFNRLQHVTGTT